MTKKSMVNKMWYKNDPRHSIGKRANIVIVDLAINKVFFALVDTKEAFVVITAFSEKPIICEDEEWPASWIWAFRPTRDSAIARMPDWKSSPNETKDPIG